MDPLCQCIQCLCNGVGWSFFCIFVLVHLKLAVLLDLIVYYTRQLSHYQFLMQTLFCFKLNCQHESCLRMPLKTNKYNKNVVISFSWLGIWESVERQWWIGNYTHNSRCFNISLSWVEESFIWGMFCKQCYILLWMCFKLLFILDLGDS